ncbi:MAG TPA: hypothetical protein VF533_14360 [Solirubrobacteraceae bacterium]|jgi:uncharacterized membrane protein YoaK (UPF0700 family)
MSTLPYTIMIGAVVVSLLTGIIGEGKFWIVPAVILPLIAIYAVVDRRLKQKEDSQEDEAVHSAKGGASGAT